MDSFEHIDHPDKVKLVNIQEIGSDGKYHVKQRQWNSSLFRQELSNLFHSVPFYSVDENEYYLAGKAVDDFIYDNYDETIINDYEVNNNLPETLEADIKKKYPRTFEQYLHTMAKVLQNRYCKYNRLKKEIPGRPGVKIFLWSGHKVTGPFSVERNVLYNICIIEGRKSDIDAFVHQYGV